jgi:hypothetical protein
MAKATDWVAHSAFLPKKGPEMNGEIKTTGSL